MLIELSLLLGLILINGLFAMSEIAVVGSRRTRLAQMADSGRAGASHALALSAEPTRFLSTVQLGITTVGILSGAVGEATIAERLRTFFEQVPELAPYANGLSLAVLVVCLTYVSVVVGELIPKRLALTRPERIASLIARPMQWLSWIGRPVVHVLSASTDAVLRLLRVRKVSGPAVTLEEFKVLIEQATLEGVFDKTEEEMVTNVLRLDERTVNSILTPRAEIVHLDVRDSFEHNREKLTDSTHAVMPLCDGGLDHVIGFVRSTEVLARHLRGERLELAALAAPPLFVPGSVTLMRLLEQFKRTHLPIALVVDEFGSIDGLVSLTDVMTAIVGELPPEPGEEPLIIVREDGSWLVDGRLDLDQLWRVVDVEPPPDRDEGQYHTLGGLAMLVLGRVPRTGDVFVRHGLRFEVVDMDVNRVDRVLISRMPDSTPPAQDRGA